MGIAWCRELSKARSQSGKFKETYEYTRAWLVRTDSVNTPMPDITNAAGIAYQDSHPDDASCKALEFTTQAADDAGMLFKVSVKYYVPPADQGSGGEDQPQYIAGIMRNPVWSGGSTVRSVPIYKDKDNEIIRNSAGDPLEGLQGDEAEFKLTLTGYVLSHTDWMNKGRQYTNRVNSDTWNGGAPRTWKCQGIAAHLQTVNKDGNSWIFWEVVTEFAYRADTWDLKPWDIGFHERVTEDGTPSSTGTKRRVIVGQDKKPVKSPVALSGGVALPAGTPPEVINNGAGVQIYHTAEFGTAFGEVYTPTIPDE